MAGQHGELHSTCVRDFAVLKLEVAAIQKRQDRRSADLAGIRELLAETREDVLSEIATLKERSRNWGIIGGMIGSALLSIVAAIVLAVIL